MEELLKDQSANSRLDYVHVLMEREYLRAYKTFERGVAALAPKLLGMFEGGDAEG